MAVFEFPASAAHEAAAVVAESLASGIDERARALVEHYFGDTTPGASLQRFLDTVHDVIVRRDAQLAERDARA